MATDKTNVAGGMQGRVVLITGGTGGIGKVAALELARMGASVVIVGRNSQKTADVVREIQDATRNPLVDSLIGDLSVQAEVQKVAEAFRARYDKLHILLNNAGMIYDTKTFTVDGLEQTFALNHMSYFLLTNLVLDMLKESAPSRIINVSSAAHATVTSGLNFDNLQGEKNWNPMSAYGRSKFLNLLFTYELARRLQGTGITVNALHPGSVNTGFSKNNSSLPFRLFVQPIVNLMGMTPEQGAETSIYLASSPEVETVSGKYFEKSKPVNSNTASYNIDAQRKLWDVSTALSKVPVK